MAKIMRDWITYFTLNGTVLDSNWKPKTQLTKVFRPPSEKPQIRVIGSAIDKLKLYLVVYHRATLKAITALSMFVAIRTFILSLSPILPKTNAPRISPKPRPTIAKRAY